MVSVDGTWDDGMRKWDGGMRNEMVGWRKWDGEVLYGNNVGWNSMSMDGI